MGKAMNNKIWLIVPLSFLIAGCATSTGKRLSSLETKVGTLESKVESVEQRQSALESQPGGARELVGYLKGKPESSSKAAISGGNEGNVYNSGKTSITKKEIQIALKNAGFYSGTIDGRIGKNTRKAIKEFQKANGLPADGVVGKKTKSLLISYLKKVLK